MTALGSVDSDTPTHIFEQDVPAANGHDLLVKITAIAVNPVDIKVKASLTSPLESPRILGWDATGTVEAVGEMTSLFEVGDKVFYAGDITRPGCYASHQLVDERIVGRAPTTLSVEQAAAMPLTSITAWEALFSRLKINPELDKNKTILIIGGAGGVGSIAIQLAKKVAKLTVVASASKPESEAWCRELGADYIINHHHDMTQQFEQLSLEKPDYILCLADTDQHFDNMAELIAAEGLICSIVETKKTHNLDTLKSKSAGFVWEFMFTRPMMKTNSMIKQHQLLNTVAELLDKGELRSTLKQIIGPISPETIAQAHRQLATGTTIGKLVLTGFK